MSDQDVKIMTIAEVLDEVYPDWVINYGPDSYRIENGYIHRYLRANDAWYYAAPNDEFDVNIGVMRAALNNKLIVVVDNMS